MSRADEITPRPYPEQNPILSGEYQAWFEGVDQGVLEWDSEYGAWYDPKFPAIPVSVDGFSLPEDLRPEDSAHEAAMSGKGEAGAT